MSGFIRGQDSNGRLGGDVASRDDGGDGFVAGQLDRPGHEGGRGSAAAEARKMTPRTKSSTLRPPSPSIAAIRRPLRGPPPVRVFPSCDLGLAVGGGNAQCSFMSGDERENNEDKNKSNDKSKGNTGGTGGMG